MPPTGLGSVAFRPAAAASSLPSRCSWGRIGSSQRGIHHALAPSSAMIAGTRIIRTSDASMKTATAMPTASIFTAIWSFRMKLAKTVTMIAAA
ncbi:MAG TPA: hypothetical protein VMC83_20860, partial [Streptosporangiaceae bacterium]|nr:hypothetical protein [Streptosporangiaceae bacterium]